MNPFRRSRIMLTAGQGGRVGDIVRDGKTGEAVTVTAIPGRALKWDNNGTWYREPFELDWKRWPPPDQDSQ